MGELIHFDHIRRSMRLFKILVEQYGLEHFVEEGPNGHPLVDFFALEESVLFAADWMKLRTGTPPSTSTKNVMRRSFYRVLLEKVGQEGLQSQSQ